MAKVAFSTLKLKQNKDVKTFKIGDKDIEVLQYLPASDKYDLIMSTLQESYSSNIYNAFLKEMYFNLNLVFMYTNISFTDKQKEDLIELYDLLECNGVFNEVINLIPQTEYDELKNCLEEIEASMIRYNYSLAGNLGVAFDALPQIVESATSAMNNFDPSQFKEVINFAKAVGLPQFQQVNLD